MEENNRGGGGGGERGFGSGGDQILLDGKRITAKSNGIRDILSRTSADQVERVDLIRGAADGLDVQTEGLVINVILREGADRSSTFWKLGAFYQTGHKVLPDVEISHQGALGDFDYTFAAEGLMRSGKFSRSEIAYDSNNVNTGATDMNGTWNHERIKLTSNLSYDFGDGEILNVNGLYNTFNNENDQYHVDRQDSSENLFWDFGDGFLEWEIAGDYSRDIDYLGNLKTRFLINREGNFDNLTNRFEGDGASQFLKTQEIFDFGSSEEIFRASFTKNITANQSLEYGAEGAFNGFRQVFLNSERDTALDPLVLTDSNNIKIRENRYEVFAHHNYTINPQIVLQSSLTTEFSKITSETILDDADNILVENSFTFFKPRINFRYDLSPSQQLRVIAEKKVSQLEFFHYMTFFDQITKEIRFGNNDIRPEETWEFSATYEYRLPNDGGNIEIKPFYHVISNYIARADFSTYLDGGGNPLSTDQYFALPPSAALRDDTDFSSKFDNIGDASAYGVEVDATLRLGFIGLSDAQLSLGYEYNKKRFSDNFTGLPRMFSWNYDHEYSIDFRHDISEIGLAYGIEAEISSGFGHADIDFDWQFDGRTEWEIFIEKTILGDIKARLEVEKNGEVNTKGIFYRFNDHRRFNELKNYEEHLIDQPYRISFSVEGTF